MTTTKLGVKMQQYTLHRQGCFWYVIPDVGYTLPRLPFPENFPRSFFKKEAIKIKEDLELAWDSGRMYAHMFEFESTLVKR